MVPDTMIAVAITAPGGPEVLVPERRPVPDPRPNEVLIRVRAAGVNRHDCGQRRRGAPPEGATDIPGLEVAGEIVGVGDSVARWQPGARVCALVNGGGYAEYCVADHRHVLPIPEGFDWLQAAALPEALFTTWLDVFQLGRLQSGEWLLVHGGTSGVGSFAIQLARAFGCLVIATAGSKEKCDAARRLGAQYAVNYREEDFVAAVNLATDFRGVDVILDMVGGTYAERNLQALAPEGRLVHLTTAGTPRFDAPLELILKKRAIVTGSFLRPYPADRKANIAEDLRLRVWPLLGQSVHPVIDSVFALADARAAHERIESSRHIGKILLDVAARA